ncbi:hypothetical protein GCK32_005704 [Trichostrongylus colubriformis]|uniref:Uncharacterized protein n=1 Tax=Trichostrongylus colubriformis TaxID=6319 RepID=A0AAN8G3R2_TRICO
MMLILLAILVGTVPSESSLVNSDYRVHNDHCKYSEVKQQPFKEIANSSLRSFLLRKLRGIGDTDCVQSYQVEFNNDSNPFYVFRIDRETRFSRNYTVCGVVTVVGGDFMWKSCDKSKFKDYLLKCESEENRHPQLPPVLSCDRTPNPVSPLKKTLLSEFLEVCFGFFITPVLSLKNYYLPLKFLFCVN